MISGEWMQKWEKAGGSASQKDTPGVSPVRVVVAANVPFSRSEMYAVESRKTQAGDPGRRPGEAVLRAVRSGGWKEPGRMNDPSSNIENMASASAGFGFGD